jgi:sialate O-acetylesterase
MKTPLRIITLAVLYITLLTTESACQEKERRTNLQGYWKFILGDNMKFAKPEYDDADWEKIYVPDSWQDEGFRNYHGYAWYRKTVEIDFESNDILYLELGKIDDVDEVYLNGHLIGSTGGFPPDYVSAYNYHRRYLIPVEHINKNGKNVIAVRVYDEHGEGGIIGSPVGIYHYANYSQNSLNLFGKWKFHLFDNIEWSKENFDDSEWEDIIVPAVWESQGFRGYDGFAWYRKTFKLPSNFQVDDLMLLLGKVDDMDEVYVNGTLIGATGNINRKWASNDEYNRYRNYSVPDDLLRPGKENVIAVRVYDQQQGGGIYEGPITIIPRSEYKQFWRNYREENFDFEHWVSHYFFDN